MYRFKFGIRLRTEAGGAYVPSTTVVLGPFGDIVLFDNGDLYLSWYPVCLGGMSSEPSPDWPRELDEAKSRSLFEGSLAALRTICPALSQLEGTDMRKVTIQGGVIVAWGQTDINKIDSELHDRFDIGPFSRGPYHSIDTGKYCVAPMFAVEIADRICPEGGHSA